MKKVSVFIVLLICAVNICCVRKKTANNAADMEIKNIDIEIEDIEGYYINDEKYTSTPIELIIIKDGNGYKYTMTTPNRKLEGRIGTSVNPDCFALEGIRWASWEIDGEPQELPEDVAVYIEEGGLLIQNSGGSSMGNNSYLIFDDIEEKYINLKKKYVTLPNGTMMNARIPEDVADMMFKRFEAIENGDIDIDSDAFEEAVTNGGEELPEIARTLFNAEHPLRRGNTGLSLKNWNMQITAG